MNNLCPIFLKIDRRPILVVGGGKVAEQKINSLLETQADLTVIGPEVSPAIERFAKEGRIHLSRREFRDGDVDGFYLVIGATDDRKVQEKIFSQAQSKGIPVNIVDVPELCTFYLSSVFRKGDLKVAVSTNGKSPTLGKIIRDKIRDEFSEDFPELLEKLGDLRLDVQNTFPDFESRKKLHEQIVRSELDQLERKRETGSRKPEEKGGRRETIEWETEHGQRRIGKVVLVGAGPGDSELITVKGLKILRGAQVVLYDALVSNELLDEAPEDAEKIFVGKRAGEHCMKQEEINNLLILKAHEGKRIVRLKGGDPFVFGRGGEEVEALREAGIDVEFVPGVTAGIGVPTSLGIPLTHRKKTSSVLFVTGHADPMKNDKGIDWKNLSHADTIVIYMGTRKLNVIVDELIRSGVPRSKPIAVILGGTLPEEKVIVGTLENIGDAARNISHDLPGLIIVGEVVASFKKRGQYLPITSAVPSVPDILNEEIF